MSNMDETQVELEEHTERIGDVKSNSDEDDATVPTVERHDNTSTITNALGDAVNALENNTLEKNAFGNEAFENEMCGTGGSDAFVKDSYITGGFVDDIVPEIPVHSRRLIEIGSESLITDDDLRLAATLVQEAMDGRPVELKKEPRFIRSYNRFRSWWLCRLLDTAVVVNICLVFCEEPAVTTLALPYWITMIIEVLCLAYFTCRLSHQAYWRLWKDFKTDARNIIAAIILLLTVADMVVYVVMKRVTRLTAIRWSRCLRPVLIMAFSDGTHLRKAWSNIRQTLHEIIHVILLFYFLIVVFSLLAMKMFQYRTDITFPDGSPYFKDYLESYWQLYVLVTTSNNPDVMLPAYDGNRWYCLFFTIYVILCLYLMLNILLAVTYSSYRGNMKKQIRDAAREKTRTLNEAFEVIKINNGGQEMVTYRTWSRLIKLAHPGKTKYQIDLLMLVLDTDQSGYISREQFLSVADLLNVPVSEVGDRKNWCEVHLPALYTALPSQLLKAAVDTIYFSLLYDAIVIGHVVLICLNIDVAEWAFLAMYCLEIILKCYTLGVQRYFYGAQHWFDVIITVLSLVLRIWTELQGKGEATPEVLNVINVLRIFRLLRCLVDFSRFRIIFDAVVNVSMSIFTYCGILFIVFYVFALLGMELFHGKIQFLGYSDVVHSNSTSPSNEQLTCNNPALNGSTFADYRYCRINFNDIINAFVVLCTLLVGNNWQIVAEGFVLVTNKGTRVYFMMFHLCVTVVVMNIVTAFILDMFLYEYTFSKRGGVVSKVEMTIKKLQLGIDDETGMEISDTKDIEPTISKEKEKPSFPAKTVLRRMTHRRRTMTKPNLSRYDGIRFHIQRRGWRKTELLLQQLFELEEEHAGENPQPGRDYGVNHVAQNGGSGSENRQPSEHGVKESEKWPGNGSRY